MTRSNRSLVSLAVVPLILAGLFLAGSLRGSKEDEVGVYDLTFYRTNEILVHLNAAPFKTNILQYTGSLSNGTTWSNLYVPPVLPFQTHYVIVDTRTAPQRYYRLIVLP